MRLRNYKNSAFSLVEVTLALGVAAFCLIAVFGLIPVGVQTNRNATSQTAATNIVAIGHRRSASHANREHPLQRSLALHLATNAILYFDGAGQATTSPTANSRYQLNMTWGGSSALTICRSQGYLASHGYSGKR